MALKYTEEQLNSLDRETLIRLFLSQQEQLENIDHTLQLVLEQMADLKRHRFGRSSEKHEAENQISFMEVDGKIVFFNEAEAVAAGENTQEEPENVSRRKPQKKQGKREEDLEGLPVVVVEHSMTDEELEDKFGKDGWKRLPDEVYRRYSFTPAKIEVEEHHVKVYAGKETEEVIKAPHPQTLLRGSLVSPSLEAAVMNAKYVNAVPLYRQEQEFERYGLHISRQNMANWTIQCADRYLAVLYDYLHEKLYGYHVLQADETPVLVNKDGRPAGSKSYMWVHLTGELSPGPKIVVYEYQKTRHSDHPKEYYKDFKGILMTDGLEQYHKLAREQEGITNANCFAHARRHFANAIKAMGKGNGEAVKASVAYKALVRIGAVYDLEGTLKNLSPEARLSERQSSIRPLVEEYFAWIKDIFRQGLVLPKSETAKGLAYSINQEEYLKVFLTDGEVPIDDSASERALRNFTIGRKNWVTINTVRGAQASAVIYSLTETARANNLNVYYYIKHLLTELPRLIDENGSIEQSMPEPFMPWSETLPADCYSKRRK